MNLKKDADSCLLKLQRELNTLASTGRCNVRSQLPSLTQTISIFFPEAA
ncbi:MAG: hypothetical protein ACU826_06455 [Gammaproteobacteria bacterium]